MSLSGSEAVRCWCRTRPGLRLACLLVAVLAGALISTAVTAETNDVPEPQPASSPADHRGASLQAIGGPLFSPFLPESNKQSLHSLPLMARLGWSFGPMPERSLLGGGRFEVLLEAAYSPILRGPGRFIAGSSALVRYNTRPLPGGIVPYLQAGVGLAHADIARDDSQRLTGQRFNFTLQLGAGLRLPITARWSLDTELHYFHLSNAGLDERNLGVDALGGLIGLTHYFDGP